MEEPLRRLLLSGVRAVGYHPPHAQRTNVQPEHKGLQKSLDLAVHPRRQQKPVGGCHHPEVTSQGHSAPTLPLISPLADPSWKPEGMGAPTNATHPGGDPRTGGTAESDLEGQGRPNINSKTVSLKQGTGYDIMIDI